MSTKTTISLYRCDLDRIFDLTLDWYKRRQASVDQNILGDRYNRKDARQALRIIRALIMQLKKPVE